MDKLYEVRGFIPLKTGRAVVVRVYDRRGRLRDWRIEQSRRPRYVNGAIIRAR